MSNASAVITEPLTQEQVYAKLSHNYQQWRQSTTTTNTTKATRDGKPVVLVSTGSYNPIHVHHVQVFQEAKKRMERKGYVCLAGFLSPSHDHYVSRKLLLRKHQSSHFIPSRHRYRMIHAAVQDSDWLSAHPWEMSQDGFVDFGPTLHQIRLSIHAWLGDETVQVRYLCGMDHALKCHLLGSYGASLGLVALARPGSRLGLTAAAQLIEQYKQGDILVLQDDDNLLDAETAAASSTAVRKAIIASAPRERLTFLDSRVENYLRQHAKDIGGIYQALAEPQT